MVQDLKIICLIVPLLALVEPFTWRNGLTPLQQSPPSSTGQHKIPKKRTMPHTSLKLHRILVSFVSSNPDNPSRRLLGRHGDGGASPICAFGVGLVGDLLQNEMSDEPVLAASLAMAGSQAYQL